LKNNLPGKQGAEASKNSLVERVSCDEKIYKYIHTCIYFENKDKKKYQESKGR
jgi:hypothetical protein